MSWCVLPSSSQLVRVGLGAAGRHCAVMQSEVSEKLPKG